MKHHLLLSSVSALVIAAPAAAQDGRHAVNLPAGRLGASLVEAARQTGMQLIFTDPAIAAANSPPVSGNLTAREALDRLLNRSAFTYRFTGPRSVRVLPKLATATASVRDVSLQTQNPPPSIPDQGGASTAMQNSVETTAVEDAVAGEGAAAPDIVVVGSQIQGSKLTAALPVTVIDQQQVVATAAVSGDELFRSIPQNGDVTFNSSYLPNSSNSARGDVGSVNLRNLGVGNTLVLLNGRRVVNHPTSRADDNLTPTLTYNTNAIPVFGLERLEVLRDGAAAIYGSDAVAGVVNTVLKKDFSGVEAETQIGFSETTNLLESNLNLLVGSNLGGRGNITVFGSYNHRSAQGARDEPYTASADKRPLFADTIYAGSTSLDGRSTITPFGSFQTLGNVVVRRGTTALTNTSGQFHVQTTALAGCPAGGAGNVTGTLCVASGTSATAGIRDQRFDAPLAYNTSVIPEVERINLFANGHYDVTDGIEVFGEAGYYTATTDSIQSSTGTLSSGPLVIPASNYYNPFGATTINGVANPNRLAGINAPVGGLAVTLSSYNFSDVGPTLVHVKNDQYRALGGVRFEAAGLRWESALLYSAATVRDTSDGLSQTLLQRQLALSTPDAYNPFNGGNPAILSGRDSTPSSAAAISAIRIKTTRFSKSTLALADIKGSTTRLIALPGGDVGLAIGAEIRRETQLDDRDPRVDGTIQFTDPTNGFINGSDLVGSSPSPDTSGHRTVSAAYAELAIPLVSPDMNIPLINNLELQLAGRFEHYSDVGSVAKPKIAGAWDIVRGLRVRGSYAQGFKAPNLEQINATVVTRSNTRTDYVRCEAQLRTSAITNFNNCSQAFATTAQRSGNPDLKPETSDTWSAGVVLQPGFLNAVGRVTFTADYWDIKQKGIVGLFGEGNALINDYVLRTQGSSDPNVIRDTPTAEDVAQFAGSGLTPVGRVLFVKDQYVNLLPQEVSGVDLGFNWRLPDFGVGRFTVNANAAYLEKFFLTPSPAIQVLLDARAAGTINAGTVITGGGDLVRRNGKARWKVTGSLTWDYRMFQIGGYTAYTGDVYDTGLSDASGNYLQVDGLMTFNLYGQFGFGDDSQGRYRMRFGVRNLTNEAPPLTSDGFNATLYNPYGRYWYTNFRVSF
ncbi:MAG: TonB-dependent receptor [Pseudomonadota bacterium]|nr:TonB-dependent receptor [Pseudomonadota bacterium]